MKIYINEQHQIKAIRFNDTGDNALTEMEVDDGFLQGFCDSVIKAFCYHKWKDENNNELLSVYPYKDFELLMSIQAEHDTQEAQVEELTQSIIDNDYRLSMMELGL